VAAGGGGWDGGGGGCHFGAVPLLADWVCVRW